MKILKNMYCSIYGLIYSILDTEIVKKTETLAIFVFLIFKIIIFIVN